MSIENNIPGKINKNRNIFFVILFAIYSNTGRIKYCKNKDDRPKNIRDLKHTNPPILPQFHISVL